LWRGESPVNNLQQEADVLDSTIVLDIAGHQWHVESKSNRGNEWVDLANRLTGFFQSSNDSAAYHRRFNIQRDNPTSARPPTKNL
jgi:hypothetical protein